MGDQVGIRGFRRTGPPDDLEESEVSLDGSETSNGRQGGEGRRSLRDALERALAREGAAADRLAHARTSVAFRLRDARENDVTLLLDRHPCEIAEADDPAEVEIVLDAEQAEGFASGRLSLVSAVVTGSVETKGPVRKYLEVDPILRALLEDEAADAGHEHQAPLRQEKPIDADLLAIETRDLHKSFGSQTVLNGLNLAIPEGAISVILGPSGTGKSVCLQHIIGLLKPDAGEVLIRGRALSEMSRSEVLNLRRDIGVMFQDGALFSAMNVYDNVAFPLRQHTDFKEPEVRELVEMQLRSVGLGNAGNAMPNELSGGMRKRAGLARAMILNPGIVLCDEPDSGLDPVRTALLGDLISERHAEQGGTIVVVTHNILLARAVADHISVIWQGEVLEAGMKEQILESDTEFIQQFMAGAPEGPLGMDA